MHAPRRSMRLLATLPVAATLALPVTAVTSAPSQAECVIPASLDVTGSHSRQVGKVTTVYGKLTEGIGAAVKYQDVTVTVAPAGSEPQTTTATTDSYGEVDAQFTVEADTRVTFDYAGLAPSGPICGLAPATGTGTVTAVYVPTVAITKAAYRRSDKQVHVTATLTHAPDSYTYVRLERRKSNGSWVKVKDAAPNDTGVFAYTAKLASGVQPLRAQISTGQKSPVVKVRVP